MTDTTDDDNALTRLAANLRYLEDILPALEDKLPPALFHEVRVSVHHALRAMREHVMDDMAHMGEQMENTAVLALGAHRRSRQAFPDPTPVEQMPTILAVVCGDIARQARSAEPDTRELTRELGNLVLTASRWIDDQGVSIPDALDRAADSQTTYALNAQLTALRTHNGDERADAMQWRDTETLDHLDRKEGTAQ